MSRLAEIRNTAQEIAEAITAVLGIDVEIVDEELSIVAGTGRYKEKIGEKEEEGNLDSEYTYGQALRTGEEYIIEDASSHPQYAARESELAEVCCPIRLHEEIIGLIGLVAFTEQQRHALLLNRKNLLAFSRQMAVLLASKVSETKMAGELKIIIETIREGIIAVDRYGNMTTCNETAARLIGTTKEEAIGTSIFAILPFSSIREVLRTGEEYRDREEIYQTDTGGTFHFFTTIRPIFSKPLEEAVGDQQREIVGAVISLRDIADIKKLVYDMTEKEEGASFHEVLGTSKAIREVKDQASKVARSQSTVLITGESGTGKGLFARSIHYASDRKEHPFVTVNCGAIPDTLLESELFGYEPGAFTGANRTGKVGKFELANGGTLFLDEIGDLSFHLQVKLLHVLQHREIERIGGKRTIPIDVRIIAATHQDLEQMMEAGEFREDLYFRLHVIPLHIPPLRERQEDILPLLDYALHKYTRVINKSIYGFTEEALDCLKCYDWPGNIRELENAVEYAVNMENGDNITLDALPKRLRQAQKSPFSSLSLKKQLEAVEKEIIQTRLAQTGYSLQGKRDAARLLGISESTLYRRIRELRIEKQ
ncbi:sigma-54-dependent Fis family transcriptional regulator [Aneurinibacillus aneurinilyticus]|uniref:sigma-54-dependent Fis family transcriptional regulator n=1 Tax=Aneurinibacillus aneurinilyticus TaxID=1391 RepID=UPI003526015A